MFVDREQLQAFVVSELEHCYKKHGKVPWGKHEFYAILLEEVDEVWEAIKKDLPPEEVLKEVIQVIAVCFRYYETGDKNG